MSVDNEGLSMEQSEDASTKLSKRTKFSYTRDFLLSLSNLEACKKLPGGFDASVLSEFDEISSGGTDRQRSSLLHHGFRRTEYGSSPPTRGDSVSSYSKGLNRWDSRSSARSDTDSHSDKDSDSGRRFGNQFRRPWQNPEHDGLLGSGSFPRPPGHVGTAVPRLRPNDNQLGRSNEPYHPPRPYKAAPLSRREITDSLNDETFGSAECTNDDRVEEEKKRRAEFELMRKEQHKVLQEKINQKSDKKKEDPFIAALMENHGNDKVLNESDDHGIKPAPENGSKVTASSQAPPSRPLVPPGFANTLVDKSSLSKSLVHPGLLEVGNSDMKDVHEDGKKLTEHIGPNEQLSEIASQSSRTADLSFPVESSFEADVDSHPPKASGISDLCKVLESSEIVGLDFENVAGHKIMGGPGHSTSILEKLFGSVLTVSDGGTPHSVQDLETNMDDVWSPKTVSSKFTPWFNGEEKKSREDASFGKSNNLLSLIVSGEKGRSVTSDLKSNLCLPSDSSAAHMTPSPTFGAGDNFEHLHNNDKPGRVTAVLTCEDLEQSILSEVSEIKSKYQLPGQLCSSATAKVDSPEANVDNRASEHLLSLLQKGTDSGNTSVHPIEDGSCYRQHEFEGNMVESYVSKTDKNAKGKALTLEALFGTAFMNELQSTNALVSAQKSITGNDGGALSISSDGFLSSASDELGSKRVNFDDRASNNFDKMRGHWLGLDDPSTKADILKLETDSESKIGGFDGASEVRLPEEDSLISLGDPGQSAMFVRDLNASNSELLSSSSSGGINIVDKLRAAANNELYVARQEAPAFLHGSYDMVRPESQYHNIHALSSSPQFHPPHMNHGRPIFHHLDSHPGHVDPRLKFLGPDGAIHHDAPAPMHHQFTGEMIHPLHRHSSSGLPEFDRQTHHPMIQQMHMSNGIPPPHVLQGFPGGMPALHPSNDAAGFPQDQNPIHGFPYDQPQPNLNGPGMPLRVPERGGMSNPSEVFQRLMEVEMRSNPKQMQRLPPGGHVRPMHGHELDTGLWYR